MAREYYYHFKPIEDTHVHIYKEHYITGALEEFDDYYGEDSQFSYSINEELKNFSLFFDSTLFDDAVYCGVMGNMVLSTVNYNCLLLDASEAFDFFYHDNVNFFYTYDVFVDYNDLSSKMPPVQVPLTSLNGDLYSYNDGQLIELFPHNRIYSVVRSYLVYSGEAIQTIMYDLKDDQNKIISAPHTFCVKHIPTAP